MIFGDRIYSLFNEGRSCLASFRALTLNEYLDTGVYLLFRLNSPVTVTLLSTQLHISFFVILCLKVSEKLYLTN